MTQGRTALAVFLTVIAALLMAIIGLWTGPPPWSWPAFALPPAIAPVAVRLLTRRRPGAVPVDMAPYLPLEPVERRAVRVTKVVLPSREADYDFLFSATVRWHLSDEDSDGVLLNPAGLAVQAVLERARPVTASKYPARSSLVQHQLNGLLGVMEPEATGRLYAMAEDVRLTLAEHDQARLDKLAAVRKDEAVWQHERRWELSKREYLGGDALKNTGNAVIWWLARNDDEIEKTVNDLGLLAQLAAAANDEDVPARLRHLVPNPAPDPEPGPAPATGGAHLPKSPEEHLATLLTLHGLTDGDDRRDLLLARWAEVAEQNGLHDLAQRLYEHIDPPGPGASHDLVSPNGAGPGDSPLSE